MKTTFRKRVVCKRKEKDLTQAQMSELLEISERSYSDLEKGKFCCSAITLALYMINYSDDVQAFLDELKDRFERADEDVA